MTKDDLKSVLISGRLAWIAFGLSFLLFVAAGWPGWMSVDTLGMHARATDGPIYDWHSPILLWVWKYAGAAQFGPLFPFLVQATLFWIGLLLLVGRLQRLGWKLAWLIFPGVFLLDATWIVAWVWKDSLTTSVLLLMLGLAASTDVLRKQRWVWLLIGVLAALLVATRWYLAPLPLLALITLFCMTSPIPRRTIGITLLTFLITALGLYSFERLAIKPEKTYVSGVVMMLDIARVECVIGNPKARRAGNFKETLFPAELMRHVPKDDICSRYSTFVQDPLMMDGSETEMADYNQGLERKATQTHYVLPDSDASMSRLTGRWLDVVRKYPGLLGEARVKQVMAFFSEGPWWSPARDLRANNIVYGAGLMGDGEKIGFANRGQAPLVVGAALSYLGSLVLLDVRGARFGLLSLILIPAFTAAFGWRRGGGWRLHYLPALGFPVFFFLSVAVISPGTDVRYMIPAAIWALGVAALALADRTGRAPSTENQNPPAVFTSKEQETS